MQKTLIKKVLPEVAVVLFFLLLSFLYFQTPLSEGLVLGGHDNDASVGLAQDVKEYQKDTGETSRWTNSIFSGMPTYQISPTYESTRVLTGMSRVYSLGTTGVWCYVFLYLLGFYLLMRALRFRPWISVLGAIAWAFSSYFFIIIAAGHIWKVMTLAFIPPTIAGLVLCYRGKYLWGGTVTALFTSFQILSNHIQMSYYFGFVMACIIVAYGVAACRRQRMVNRQAQTEPDAELLSGEAALPAIPLKTWTRGTAAFVVGGLLGVMANLPNLYHTYDYAKETMRGKSELTPLPDKDGNSLQKAASDGLDYDYITGWSYGVDETLTLLIPDFKGGGSQENMLNMPATQDQGEAREVMERVSNAFGISGDDPHNPLCSSYWGRQPMTMGPVYVGAVICFLFLLGIFLVNNPMSWALLVATLISFVFAWGSDVPAITHFLIDHLPLYNKFRTVSSALVMAEFTIPLLALLALAEILRRRNLLAEPSKRNLFLIVFAASAGLCLAFWWFPALAGDCITDTQREFIQGTITPNENALGITTAQYTEALTALRHAILSASACRSFFLILLGAVLIWAYSRFRVFRGWMLCTALSAICLGDLWLENKRYLNDDNFSEATERQQSLETETPADRMILGDRDLHYRVADIQGMGSNTAACRHKLVGGYHPAKLSRYNDLLERCLNAEVRMFGSYVDQLVPQLQEMGLDAGQPEMWSVIARHIASDSLFTHPVLNMLNTKYLIGGNGAYAVCNEQANGNAWFVDSLVFVEGADAEMAALTQLDTHRKAVADAAFRCRLDKSALGEGTARLIEYAPNRLAYEVDNPKGGLLVFSEVYYPGWTAAIDGKPAELGRVNYLLRALKVPAGKHRVTMEFSPQSVKATNGIAYAAIAVILLGLLAAATMSLRPFVTHRR